MAVNKVDFDGITLVDLTGDTVTANDLADGVIAHGANGETVVGLLPKVEIDSVLSSISTNPVQNKVITSALESKADDDEVLHNTRNVIPDTTNVLFGHESDKSWLGFLGGTSGTNGSSLFLNGANTGDNEAGRFELTSVDANKKVYTLSGESNGSLIWCGKHIVRSVNGTNADKSGNVTLTLPTKTSDLTNDSGYLTQHQSLAGYVKSTDLASVATSGSYTDLTDKPFIPDISNKADKSTTLAGYGITDAKISNGVIMLGSNTITPITEVDTGLSATSTNPLQNRIIYDILTTYVKNTDISEVAKTGDYKSLLNKPTSISAFNNDVGYLTEIADASTEKSGLMSAGDKAKLDKIEDTVGVQMLIYS